jgi:hypothetical protein
VTLSFVDERQFLNVIPLVLPLHECADPALAECGAEPLHSVVDCAAADPVAIESTIEPLHSATDLAGSGAGLTETFCLCVRI